MDGTVHISGTLIKGAAEAVEFLRRQARVIFLTNNTSVSRLDYVEKLKKMGIASQENDVYTAGNATIEYLKRLHKNKKVFLLGTERLRAEFSGNGINLSEKSPELVVVGFDTDLKYENISKACSFIRSGVPYLLTHPDINCPVADGYIPDVGAINALIEKSTGKKPFIVCGKPHSPIAEALKSVTNCKNDEIAMVGDRLSTDMLFALSNGFLPILVLSGETTLKDYNNFEKSGKIPFVLPSIAQISGLFE